ncbi:MAG: CDP-alcohol phosphatidyltransferase family protein [Gammaproteobacteria bacterium]
MITGETDQAKLTFWSERHALLMLTASLLLPAGLSAWVLSAAASLSFSGLILGLRRRWTPKGGFGVANGVTLLRLTAVALLPAVPTGDAFFPAVVVLALDGLDGLLARRFGESSEFGEFFDKETDAFFMLMLCWLLYLDQRLGLWILLPGLLRYLFVLLLKVKPAAPKEPRTSLGKYLFFFAVTALVFCFTGFPDYYRPLALAATTLLACSFADTIRRLYFSGDFR